MQFNIVYMYTHPCKYYIILQHSLSTINDISLLIINNCFADFQTYDASTS